MVERAPSLRLLVVTVLAVLWAPQARAQPVAGRPATVAFVDVTVVPGDRPRAVPGQTVLVRGGRIAAVGPTARVKVPVDALRVDAKGKFLMPGIAEMHGHIPDAGGGDALAAHWLELFAVNGVTLVRGMQGAPNQFALRERITRGELLGPRLVLYGPPLTGKTAPTPERGVELVREHKAAGYDGLKILEGLSPATYEAIAKEAKRLRLPFGGHVPNEVGVLRALALGQTSIDHLEGYVEALLRDGALADSPEARIPSGFALGEWPGIDHLDEAKIPGLVAATRRARAMVAPTMAVWRTLWGDPDGSALRALPELRYVPAKTREAWAKGEEQRARAAAAPERLRRFMEVRDRLLRAFADAGKLIMLAADSPQRYNVPGFAMRREVAALVKAGMTPAQVIEAATIAPARFLGLQREQGTVAVGRRADLLLLEADPLVDADNIFRQAGVMVNGRWLPRAELDARLAALERSLPQ